jgi:ribosomal-protein-alanine N-acetyltransferase
VRSTPRRARRSPRSAANTEAANRERVPLDGLPLSDGVIAVRLFALSDASAIAEACRDPEIPRWTFMPEGLTVPQARAWIERAFDGLEQARVVRLAIVDANDGRFFGQVGIGDLDWHQQVGEIFYWVAAPGRRRGVATRATKLLAEWGFEVLHLARIEITVDPANKASQRVAEAAGFTREGVLRSYQRFKDGRMDSVMFSRLPSDPDP